MLVNDDLGLGGDDIGLLLSEEAALALCANGRDELVADANCGELD